MGKCALCDTPGVNKSTCPLYVKDPKPDNWKKHYKAKKPRKISKPTPTPKPKPKPIPKKIFLKKSISTIQTPRSIGRTPPARFKNPYVDKSKEVRSVKKKIMESARKNKHIILHGVDLIHFHINIKNAKDFKVKLNKSTAIVNKLDEILELILDIFIRMSQLLVTRSDFFTNPDSSTQSILTTLTKAKNFLIKFIVENREGGGGGETVPSFTVPLDVVISDLEFLATSEALSQLPTIPKTIPKLKTKTTTRKKVAMTTDAGRIKNKKSRKIKRKKRKNNQ